MATIPFVMSDLLNKLLILRSPGVGPVKYNNLLAEFGDVESVVDSMHLSSEFIDDVKREMDSAYSLGIEYLDESDSIYPQNLLNIKNHPIVITARGNTETLNKKTVAMVGTRHATAIGMEFMSDMACKFAEHNFAVVSGMAMGTDTAAHIGALRASWESSQAVTMTMPRCCPLLTNSRRNGL